MTDVLAGNRVVVDGYRYTAPSLDTGDFGRKDYDNQFMWDSCFHAIAWRWVDPAMAQDELLSLVSRQVTEGPDTGMIPHCNYWHGGGTWLWSQDDRSAITQPPLVAVAANLVFERSHDQDFLETIYERNYAYHDWFDARRDIDGDGLVTLIHPWEADGDALPRWDRAMKIESFSHVAGREARLKLAHVVTEHGGNAAALTEAGGFSVKTIDFNAIRAADMEAMAKIATTLGKNDDVEMWNQRVERIRDGFQVKMMFGDQPYDLEGPDERAIRQDSAGQFITLFGGLPTPEQAHKLVVQLQESRFWTPFPVTTTPTDDETFAPDVYWRGNVWPCTNWLVYKGLRRYGYNTLAEELVHRSLALLEQSGFWEYYHPITGHGLGGKQFSWAAVMVDMAASTS